MNVASEELVALYVTQIPLAVKDLFVKIEYVKSVVEQITLAQMNWPVSTNNVRIHVNLKVNAVLVLNVMCSTMVFNVAVPTDF